MSGLKLELDKNQTIDDCSLDEEKVLETNSDLNISNKSDDDGDVIDRVIDEVVDTDKNIRIGAIISEYNPFHNGHKYQIDTFKKQYDITHLVVIMSGNFVQRGGPALVDKYSRAKTCLENGVDLVIELPALFATQTAELFSRGAIITLNSMRCIDYLCFGSELGNIDYLTIVGRYLNTRDYKNKLRKYLDEKYPYAVAREKTIREAVTFNTDFLSSPNNILAVEYLKELDRVFSDIKAVTIKRSGVDHLDEKKVGSFASASVIRKDILSFREEVDILHKLEKLGEKNKFFLNNIESNSLKNGIIESAVDKLKGYVPTATIDNIIGSIEEKYCIMDEESYFDEIKYKILSEKESLASYFEVVEGLENSMYKTADKMGSVSELVKKLTSKRYPSSRIRRAVYNIFLGIEKSMVEDVKKMVSMPYIKVLASNEKGARILKEVKNKSNVVICDKPAKVLRSEQYCDYRLFRVLLDFDLKSSNLYYQKFYKYRSDILEKGEVDFIKSVFNLD